MDEKRRALAESATEGGELSLELFPAPGEIVFVGDVAAAAADGRVGDAGGGDAAGGAVGLAIVGVVVFSGVIRLTFNTRSSKYTQTHTQTVTTRVDTQTRVAVWVSGWRDALPKDTRSVPGCQSLGKPVTRPLSHPILPQSRRVGFFHCLRVLS
jgi:hypothetical protein